MLKWLAGSRPKSPQHEIVTDDPLATIKVDRPLEIYAVSRVNPIFDEEESHKPESPGKSASSGYGNSSDCSSGAEDEAKQTVLSEDGLTVLEQNVSFVKSILVAASPRRHGRRTGVLSPIPEGKVDYCIPRPVWPRHDAPPTLLENISSFRSVDEVNDNSISEMDVSSRAVLREVSDKLNEVTDVFPASEEALRKLSLTLSHSRHLTKMTRALSNSSSSSIGVAAGVSYTSSAASSSGFSELTHTAEDLAGVRNALLYGTLTRAKNANSTYEKLLSVRTPLKEQTGAVHDSKAGQDGSLWETYCGEGVKKGDVCLKSKTNDFYYPPSERPDFTLDMPRAEQLLKKIREAKQRRFWCRLITSFMGFVFFLLSVMVVSLLLTRGKRLFGPL